MVQIILIILIFICKIIYKSACFWRQSSEEEGKEQEVIITQEMAPSNHVHILAIETDQNLESKLFTFKNEHTLRFIIGPTLFGHKVRLYSNYPDDGESFQRNKYRELKWMVDEHASNPNDSTSLYCDIQFKQSGSFRYYFTNDTDSKVIGSGYSLVDPTLQVGDKVIPMDCLQCQTVMSKCLGNFEQWKDRLMVAHKSGYNMVHFTPIQELGGSQSGYSLRNQLKLNPMFQPDHSSSKYGFDDVAALVEFMRDQWGMLSITDIVLNHTANETPWLTEHPECTYNLNNSPHLRPSYLLDRVIWHTAMEIIDGKWESSGLTKEINQEHHIDKLRHALKENISNAKIYEMYMIDIDGVVKEFKDTLDDYIRGKLNPTLVNPQEEIVVIQDLKYRRYKSRIDLNAAIKMMVRRREGRNNKDWLEGSCYELRQALEAKNFEIMSEVMVHLNQAVENVLSSVRYERIADYGPRVKSVSKSHPLVPQYFTHYGEDIELNKEEKLIYNDDVNVFIMAHNGWVMGDDPLRNFAEPGSNVYIRRELIAWGDSVKLRYGYKQEDCPFLWNLMKTYVEETSRMFHGIRLDNCHSTPMHLAEFLLDAARKVRPNLYVIAELFTSSEDLDNLFVNRLGINSLIREALTAPDAHELGRYVHRYGGDPVGAFAKQIYKPLRPSIAHAIFFDITHDNESAIKKRSRYDLLPTSAVIAMASCATGSNRGYDEMVPHHIHVVNESRPYAIWKENGELGTVSYKDGILFAKKVLNDLHFKLGAEGYSEVFVDQVDPNVIAVTRHNPLNHKSIILVARTSFSSPTEPNVTGFIRPITIAGKIEKILFEAKFVGNPESFSQNPSFINGYRNFTAEFKQNLSIEESNMISIHNSNGNNDVRFDRFVPGSVVAFDVSFDENHLIALNQLESTINQFIGKNSIHQIINDLSLDDLNYVLFRIEQEEKDEGHGGGTYNIPNFGSFTYCGFAGLMTHWKNIHSDNDLGHPICGNLRDGDWLPKYYVDRLSLRSTTDPLASWLTNAFNSLSKIPRYIIPRYFDSLITPLYSLLLEECWNKSSKFVSNGSKLIKLLSFGGIAMVGFNHTSPLPPLSKQIKHPKPKTVNVDSFNHPVCPTIAAGLPHFASGYMRNWGRDTFIALRGLLLTTGRYDEARYIILGFAGCLRHGLIPNLLDRGVNARFNCRDAVWWWLQCIKDYCTIVPEGHLLLIDSVQRLFPFDDAEAHMNKPHEQPLYEVMQESLEKHFDGINFRERNAGSRIDEQMTDPGFNVDIEVKRDTGFISGGNEWNCGTWMDKMGSSEAAGNKGKPSTPRDGSAVELIGLSKSVVSWLQEMHSKGNYPHEGVSNKHEKWTWKTWMNKIQANFEKRFWIDLASCHDLINRKGIYKDSVGATQEWQDYQLRPNFLIAMVVAPELFDPNHALIALTTVQDVLVGPLGMKTLDPTDWNYRGNYDNANHSNDFKIAHGFNYHQGPEWLWPLGYYLRAQLIFSKDKQYTKQQIRQSLSEHYKCLEGSPWYGLPELTNADGEFCPDSCPIQAWSHATLLDVLYDMERNLSL